MGKIILHLGEGLGDNNKISSTPREKSNVYNKPKGKKETRPATLVITEKTKTVIT